MRCLLVAIWLLLAGVLKAQPPVVDFTIPATACLNETLMPTGTSTVDLYEWDFCQGDLSLTPFVTNPYSVTGNNTLGIDLVFDGTNWFGFVTDAGNNTIIRLAYGLDLNSQPTVVSLGTIFSGAVNPYDIKIVYDQGEWFGFVYGIGTGGGSALIARLDFGISLMNTPTSTILIPGGGASTSGLDVVYANNKWHIIYTRFYLVTVVKLDDIRSTDLTNQVVTSLTNTLQLGDIKVMNSSGNWFAYTVSYSGGNTLQRLSFGNTLLSTAVVTNITGAAIGSLTPFGVDGHFDNGEHILFVSTLQGSLVRINLGTDLSNPPVAETSLGALGILSNTLKIVLVKSGSSWRGFAPSYSTGEIFKIAFDSPVCQTSVLFSNDPDPQFSYLTPGTKYVTLRGYNGGAFTETSKSIVVQNLQAPEIEINNLGVCVNVAIQFSFQSNQVINTSDWDFGNGETSAVANPTIDFDAIGNYNVTLQVTSANGCQNYSEKTIKIYDPPIASFTSPIGLICTNNEITFVNTTPDNFDGNLTYQWLIDNQPTDITRDLLTIFTLPGSHDVTLQTSIPGCADDITQNVAGILEGPVTNFSFTGQCEDESVTFSNSASAPDVDYSWNFDDGQSSIEISPTHTFSDIGIYDVTLTASNAAGCNNTKTKSVPIYTKPQVNFSLSAPPFSCNGTPSQFNDLTPSPPDSNIATWAWNFGDAGSSQNTSTIKNPLHTYASAGGYNVSLLVTTNFFCSATLQLPVTISQTPVANFNHGPTCAGVPASFTDASVGTIDTWNWTIGSTSYTTQNPTHTFVSSGSTSATLTVTATNDCIGTINKPIIVPVKLTPDFSVNRNCVNQQTVFTDITNSTADPIISQNWIFGTQGTASGSPANFTFSNTGSIGVSMTVTTQAGCSYPASKSVSIVSSPQASFTPSPLAGAPPLSVQFTNTSVNATSYQWAFHDQNNSTSTAVSPTFVYQTLGEYQPDLTAFNAQNCFHTTSRTIRVVIPALDVALEGLELMEFQNGYKPAVTIFNHGNVPLINLALLLNMSGPVIREHVNAIISPNTSYRHVLSFEIPTANNIDYFCIEAEVTDITPNDNNVCLSLEQSFTSFPPYPNPSKGSFQIDWIMHETGVVNLTVMNSMGQEERVLQIESVEGLNPLIIETQGLSSGVYFVKIKYQHFTKVYRVFVSE